MKVIFPVDGAWYRAGSVETTPFGI